MYDISSPDKQWDKYYNPLIINLLRVCFDHPEAYLFGITGDLDNLGVYVARNGRAGAENLVDLYNQVIRNSISDWQLEHRNDVLSLCFIPSGEEVLILGVAIEQEEVEALFLNLRGLVMEKMRNQAFISIGDTAASFGGGVLNDDIKSLAGKVLFSIDSRLDEERICSDYFRFLSEVRGVLASELDRQKFADISQGNNHIALRQLVLTRMLLYKQNTKFILKNLANLDALEMSELFNLLGDQYGVPVGLEYKIDAIVKKIYEQEAEEI